MVSDQLALKIGFSSDVPLRSNQLNQLDQHSVPKGTIFVSCKAVILAARYQLSGHDLLLEPMSAHDST